MASSASPSRRLNPEAEGKFSQLPMAVTTARWGLVPCLKKDVGWASITYIWSPHFPSKKATRRACLTAPRLGFDPYSGLKGSLAVFRLHYNALNFPLTTKNVLSPFVPQTLGQRGRWGRPSRSSSHSCGSCFCSPSRFSSCLPVSPVPAPPPSPLFFRSACPSRLPSATGFCCPGLFLT